MSVIRPSRRDRARRRPLPAGDDQLKPLLLALAIFVASWIVAIAVAGLPA